MKKIGFITTNRVLAQSLAAAIRHYSDLEFEPCLLTNPNQVILDAEVQNIQTAVIDMTRSAYYEPHSVLILCEGLRRALPSVKALLLVPQGDPAAKDMAMLAIR